MSGVRRKLLPENGGPGSMLPTKFGNEEFGGKFGKGFWRLAVELAPPFSEAFNAKGGVNPRKKSLPEKQAGMQQRAYPRPRTSQPALMGGKAKPHPVNTT